MKQIFTKSFFLSAILILSCVTGAAEKTFGDWFNCQGKTNEISAAMTLAKSSNRPILVIARSSACAHCDSFDGILGVNKKNDFTRFASENQVVLLRTVGTSFTTKLRELAIANNCTTTSTMPYYAIFKVKATANTTLNNVNALSSDQVDFLVPTRAGFTAATNNYVKNSTINGVKIESTESAWKISTLINIFNTYFPNQFWDTLKPGPQLPQGYEDAVDMGTLHNAENLPGTAAEVDNTKWLTSLNVNMAGKSPVKWVKFNAVPGKRFCFYADSPVITPAAVPYSLTLEFYTSADDAPAMPPAGILKNKTADNLNRGFFFDSPAASQGPFYLKLSAEGGTDAATLSFALKVHESAAAPAAGSVTNPKWTGAKPGSWTMDTDAVLAASAVSGKPVLAYFNGVTWCPHCVGLEHTLLNTETFVNETANFYKLMLDFRKRDGSGPSLLTDDDGYLKNNGISQAAAAAKLASNLSLQNQLALREQNDATWSGGRIGYPTLVYCRVITVNGDYQLQPVGRLECSFMEDEPESVPAALASLNYLKEAGYVETSSGVRNNGNALPQEDGNLEIPVTTSALSYWTKFTVNDGLSWMFTLESKQTAESASLSVYDESGTNLIQRASGQLPGTVELMYTPADAETHTLWLAADISSADSNGSGTLTFSQSAFTARAELVKDEIAVHCSATTVDIPVQITFFREPDAQCIFQYSTDGNTWKDFSLTGNKRLVNVTVPVPQESFQFRIRQAAGGTCQVPGSPVTNVTVCEKSSFMPALPSTSVTLYRGLYAEIRIPVCAGPGMTVNTDGLNLPDGLTLQDNTGAHEPVIIISGKPMNVTPVNKKMTSVIKLVNGNTVEDSLEITITVDELNLDSINKKAFTARLLRTSADNYGVEGTLLVEKLEDELRITVSTQDSKAPLTLNIPDWTGYDAENNAIILETVFPSGESLRLAVEQNSRGTARFTSAAGSVFNGQLLPVTSAPAEYKGRYTLVFRAENSADHSFAEQGFMSVNVDDSGIALCTITMYDGTSVDGLRSAVTDDADGGDLLFFLPLNWQEALNVHTGRLAGMLDIVPLSKRDSAVNDVCISGCGDNGTVWQHTGSSTPVMLTPCGAFLPEDKSVIDIVSSGETTVKGLYFLSQAPKLSAAVIPNAVELEENNRAFSPAASSLLNSIFPVLNVQEDGTFTAQLPVLGADASLTTAEMKGILVATTELCCAISDNVAVGYGFFTFMDTVFKFRIYPGILNPAAAPEVKQVGGENGNLYTVSCTNPGFAVCKRLDTNALFYTQSMTNVTLETQTPWLVSIASAEGAFRESAPAAVSLKSGAAEFTCGTDEGSFIQLKPGWNLTAIPLNMALPENSKFPVKVWKYSTENNVYFRTDFLNTGDVFWIYVPTAGTNYTFSGTLLAEKIQLLLSEESWNLLTFPGTGG